MNDGSGVAIPVGELVATVGLCAVAAGVVAVGVAAAAAVADGVGDGAAQAATIKHRSATDNRRLNRNAPRLSDRARKVEPRRGDRRGSNEIRD